MQPTPPNKPKPTPKDALSKQTAKALEHRTGRGYRACSRCGGTRKEWIENQDGKSVAFGRCMKCRGTGTEIDR